MMINYDDNVYYVWHKSKTKWFLLTKKFFLEAIDQKNLDGFIFKECFCSWFRKIEAIKERSLIKVISTICSLIDELCVNN